MGLFDKVAKVGNKIVKDVTSDESKAKAKELFGAAKELIGEVAEKATSEESKAKAMEFLGTAKEKLTEAANTVQSYVDEALKEEESKSEPCVKTVTADGDCRTKILSVLAKEFGNYTVKENVSPTAFGGEGRFMNYSIAVMDGDSPKLFIMIIGKTTCTHREYRFSKEFAGSKGVSMINFIAHYPNEVAYISERLHKYL